MNLFENLQIMRENDNNDNLKYWSFTGKVFKNDFKHKICIGKIVEPIYVVGKSIGHAYSNIINAIVRGNNLYDIMNQIQVNKENIKEISEIPDNAVGSEIDSLKSILESNYGMEKYSYVGPVYRFDKLYANVKKPIYTVAKSYDEAMRNICFKLKEKYGLAPGMRLTIDKDRIKRNTEIEDLTKSIENEPKDIETKIDDPKYNFEDKDRSEEYVVESIMSFEDWLDIHFNKLVKDYAELHEMDEADVYNEDEDFEEYVNDRYEEYYRNTNRYIDDNDDTLEENVKTSNAN